VPDDQPDLPADLVQLQAAVFAAQDDFKAYNGDDQRRREALRQTEREAVLALHRHPDYQSGQWQALRKAAGAPEDRPKPE
jgi:hypothetical protein